MTKREFERRTGWTLSVTELDPSLGIDYVLQARAADGRTATKSYRMKLSTAIRLFSEYVLSNEMALEVFTRQQWRCAACEELRPLQIHHLRHRSQRGTHRAENLVGLCAECHEAEHAKGKHG